MISQKILRNEIDFLSINNRVCIGALRKKCPNTELFLVRILLYSVRIQENTDEK